MPDSASRRRSPGLGGLPPSPAVTDPRGHRPSLKPVWRLPFSWQAAETHGPCLRGAPTSPESGAGAPCPLPGHPAHPPHAAFLAGPFPRSVLRPGLRPALRKGTHRMPARPASLEAARGGWSCPGPGGARGRGPGPPCQGGERALRA